MLTDRVHSRLNTDELFLAQFPETFQDVFKDIMTVLISRIGRLYHIRVISYFERRLSQLKTCMLSTKA